MSSFVHDGITFAFREAGAGAPFVFQHGLGGDVNQIADTFTPPPGICLLTLDCRGHGATASLGDEARLNFNTFADDVIALLDTIWASNRQLSAAFRWALAWRSTWRCATRRVCGRWCSSDRHGLTGRCRRT